MEFSDVVVNNLNRLVSEIVHFLGSKTLIRFTKVCMISASSSGTGRIYDTDLEEILR